MTVAMNADGPYHIGVDVGSVAVKAVVIGRDEALVRAAPATRHFGLPGGVTRRVLADLLDGLDPDLIAGLSFTGVHGRRLAGLLDAPHEVETIAQITGTVRVAPGVRTIVSMGGQDAAIFQLSHHDGRWRLEGFTMNGPCASGTGSFIDQQAERLAPSLYGGGPPAGAAETDRLLADFIALGMTAQSPSRVACRCTVFTKSDMIHLQNRGESLADIIAGLHQGNAANFMSAIVGNRELDEPLAFIGGVAGNHLQLEAFRRRWPGITVPPHHASLGALGVALLSRRAGLVNRFDLSRLDEDGPGRSADVPRTAPLELALTRFEEAGEAPEVPGWDGDREQEAYLGVDIGSTTTKYALMAPNGALLHKRYVPTRGRPIETTRELLRHLRDWAGGSVRLLGIATTGSGRNVVGDYLSADLVIDEITAHARGATAVDPEVDTIFEIGGQDSKYISVRHTHPLDFDMNKVCAAGTGSFLHELAGKLGIDIAGEFQEIALAARDPVLLAERCTVFMESDIQSCLQQGVPRDDLIAGLCHAVVRNYLNRVVGKRPVGRRVMFLGGPSLNRGVAAAFERALGRPLCVPRHREVMGAWGAALALRDQSEESAAGRVPRPELATLAAAEVSCVETVCRADRACANECKLKIYRFGERTSIWGGDCGRYEARSGQETGRPDLFRERREILGKMLEGRARGAGEGAGTRGETVGVPLALNSLEWGVFWVHLLSELGFDVMVSPPTDQRLVRDGLASMTAETCFPVKVFHGHVAHLREQAELLFLPSVIDLPPSGDGEKGLYCPMVEGSGYLTRAALRLDPRRVIGPVLRLSEGPEGVAEALRDSLPAGLRPRRSALNKAARRAWAAQEEFQARLLRRGAEVLRDVPAGEPVWIVSGRPYNLHDERCSLGLGRHLAALGITALPLDFLDLAGEELPEFPGHYWGMGGRILRAARLIARDPRLFGLHLSNFGCGPDSFIEHFYRHLLGEKPALILELDEHSATAGLLTRLEAYRNVVGNLTRSREEACLQPA